jgi:Zn-dependent peptidase ImmA (M78 family)/transcriptional regulator with XRE-family HTH domain
MSKTIEVPVSPGVLRWARESIGKTLKDVAKRLGVSEATVEKWESSERNPTLAYLRQLAPFYKRPLAAFLLPAAPKEPALPTDFRTLPAERKGEFSGKTRLVFRRARRIQSLIGEMGGVVESQLPMLSRTVVEDDPEGTARKIRQKLDVAVQSQFEWSDERMALMEWKRVIETQGVYVLDFSFPMSDGRAFSLADNPPLIVLNHSDAATAHIFSLFHEFCHLLRGEGGICDFSEAGRTHEWYCNRFTAEFLVPAESLLGHSLVSGHQKHEPWTDGILGLLARSFKVSSEMMLRRLLTLGKTTERFYRTKKDEWETKFAELAGKRRGGKRVPSRQCVRENGVPFVRLVLDSVHTDRITYRDASDYLGVSTKYVPEVASIVSDAAAKQE